MVTRKALAMIKIGDFSRIAQVPVSALRYYADLGLLPPAAVDPFSGYRYYSLAQLPRLYRVLTLRDLGLSLEQIATLLREEVSAEQLHGMLRLRQSELRQRIEDEQARLARVEARLRQIEQEGTVTTYDVVLKNVEPQLVASIRSVVPVYSAMSGLFDELYAYLRRYNAGGVCMALYHDEGYKEHNPDVEALVYIQSSVPESERVKVRTMPGYTAVSTIHRGPFENLNHAYAALGDWAAQNGYRIVGSGRELYLEMGQDPSGHIAEVQFPVERE